MNDEFDPDNWLESVEHPKSALVDEVSLELSLRRPAERDRLDCQVVEQESPPMPFALFGKLIVPTVFLDHATRDELAFGVAYATCLDPVGQLLEDAMRTFSDEGGEAPSGGLDEIRQMTWAVIGGTAAAATAVWRSMTQFGNRERVAIREAVEWCHRAGFDPNVGVKLFMRQRGWMDEVESTREKPSPDAWAKVKAAGAVAALLPLFGALSAAIPKDELPLANAVERAAEVRKACVELGIHS